MKGRVNLSNSKKVNNKEKEEKIKKEKASAECADNKETTEDNTCSEKEVSDSTTSDDAAVTLQKDLDEAKDMLLRTAAEFDNYKKRSEREKLQVSEFVKAQTIKALLPPIDNLLRAAEADSSSADYAKGVEMTIRQLMEALEKLGLKEINPENEPFDPMLHEAVMHEENSDVPENTVVQVLQKGYMMDDTVIRPAMVKVAN